MKHDPAAAWLTLDNAALIYPAASNKNWTALFRLSAELNEEVDPEILQQALCAAVRRFPAFRTRLRGGLFWFYLENIEAEPRVYRDVANPCVRMDLRRENGYMFRVRYYHTRIAVEVFHVLADGTGGLCFLKTLLAEYLRRKYGADVPCDAEILDCTQPAPPEELEDSFLRYAREVDMPRGEQAAYRIRGVSSGHYMHIVTGVTQVDAVKEKAAAYGASVNEFLTAVLLGSILRLQAREKSKKRRLQPVKVNVPVNLRRFYPSHTMRNFASYVNPGVEPRYGEYSFTELVRAVRHYMGLELTEKRLNARFTTNVQAVRSILVRAAPLPLKTLIMKAAFLAVGDRYTSSSLSNLGNTRIPEAMARYVTRFDFMLGPLHSNPVTCGCISCNGQMVINFTRTIEEAEVERGFFTQLVRLGIPVRVESNDREAALRGPDTTEPR